MKTIPCLSSCALVFFAALSLRGQPVPEFKDISYGVHERQTLDIYLPEGGGPRPVVLFIHGGGWTGGDKVKTLQTAPNDVLKRVKAAGCALVSINYRFIADAKEASVFPPVTMPLQDAKTALQFLRLNAAKWELDPNRVVVFGGSAGAFSSLWLALSPEMAEPDSPDPLKRMSTRVLAVAALAAQTSIDPEQMRAWAGPKLTYGGHAFGVGSFDAFLKRRDEFAQYYPSISPASLVSSDDPPIWLFYGNKLDDASDKKSYHTHSPRFGIEFQKLARKAGASCVLVYPESGLPSPAGDYVDFLISHAKGASPIAQTSISKTNHENPFAKTKR
jgi:acetyl esterase/lipase